MKKWRICGKRPKLLQLELNYKIERTPNGLIHSHYALADQWKDKNMNSFLMSEKETIKEKEKQVEEKIQETVYQMRKIDEQLRKTCDQFMKQTAAYAIEGLFLPLT